MFGEVASNVPGTPTPRDAGEWRVDESTRVGEPIVYVVDPDPTVRQSLQELFRLVKLRVRAFSSAEEFLGSYDEVRAGCLVLEVNLPGVSGLDLQESLSRRGIDLPAILLSSQLDIPLVVRGLRAGAIDFVEKPLQPQILVRRVKDALRSRRRPGTPDRT